MAEHNIAFLATDHLTKLLKSHQILKLLLNESVKNKGNKYIRKSRDIFKSHKFSLLVDESTDLISTFKSMSVCTIFYNDVSKQIDVRSLGLIEVFFSQGL